MQKQFHVEGEQNIPFKDLRPLKILPQHTSYCYWKHLSDWGLVVREWHPHHHLSCRKDYREPRSCHASLRIPAPRGVQQQGKETGTEKSIPAYIWTLWGLMSFGLGSWEAPPWLMFADTAKRECWQTAAERTRRSVWRRALRALTWVMSV